MTSKPIVETDFAELPDGTLLDMIEDPNNAAMTQLAVFRDGIVRYADRFETDDRIFVAIPRNTEILKHIRLARGAKSYPSAKRVLQAALMPFVWCLDVDASTAMMLASYVLSTWLNEKLPISPYLAFVGLPHSGKTTALSLLSSLCRRSLLTSDITSASFYEACTRFTPTVLIDETATAGDQRELFHLLRAGSTKGSVAVRKNKVFNAFGPKVFCWAELPNQPALNSRCIIIPMQETERRDLLRPTHPKVLAHADDARQMLQQYRLENFNRLGLMPVPGDEFLNSRSRDLFEALALPMPDSNIREFLAVQIRQQQAFNREPLSPVVKAVLQGLELYIHENIADPSFSNSDLTAAVNLHLASDRELFRATPHRVGHVLTSLGLTDRKRTNTGWVLHLSRDTRDRIHKLVRRYGIELDNSVNRESCDFCMGRGTPSARTSDLLPQTQNAPLPGGPEGEQSELGELRELKTG
jgi:hypothetical protein